MGGCASYLFDLCVPIRDSISKIGSLLILYLENCQALYTPKSANSIPLWGPIFCSVVGGRLHVIYIYIYICLLIYLCFSRWLFQSILVLDIVERRLSVIVDYSIKARQINPTTVIYVVDVDLIDGGEIMNHWCIRFLVPISEACSTSFHNFLEKFIRTVLITDSVLSAIGAFELMVFQNRIDQLDFNDKQLSARYVKRFYDSQEHHRIRTWWSLFRWSHFQQWTRSNNVPIQERRHQTCKPQEFGSWYQIAGFKTCILNIQSYRYLLTKHLLFYCIAPPKLCLHPFAPSPSPIMKSLNEAIVGQGITIIYFNLCFNSLQL